MQRIIRLSLFAIIVVVVGLGSLWMLREPLLSLAGVSFDTGAAGETAIAVPDGLTSNVFAAGLAAPRFMAVSDDGVLFVAEREAGSGRGATRSERRRTCRRGDRRRAGL